jgi:hypothetical protein
VALEADLSLDIAQALAAAGKVGELIDQVTRAVLTLDTSSVAGQVSAAVDAADTTVAVSVEAAPITAAVDGAVDAADSEVTIEADASDVTASVDRATDAADTEVTVEADTGEIPPAIEGAVDGADTTITPDIDIDPLKEKIRDGLGEGEQQAPAAGARSGGAFASGFTRAVTGALKSLPEVTVGADTSEADREIASIRDELLRLNDQTIGVDISGQEAAAELGRLQARLDDLGAQVSEPSVKVDVAAANAALGTVRGQLDAVESSSASVGAAAADAGDGFDVLGDSLDDVSLGLVAASGNGVRLRGVIQAISAAGAAVGLFQAAQAASDLAESSSKAAVVFGTATDQVAEFGRTSATSIGLSEQKALEATGTFGNLFVALGTTKQQAADLAPEVVALGADLASFNNLEVDETLEKIRSGLVGEVEPLRSLGVSFNAAQVDAKAMELGLADANGEISEGAKLQARWALILEQTGTAQGDFARTSEGLANQQRILSAEVQNAQATIGQALLPVLLEGVSVARQELIPAFTEFGTDVLPALASAVIGLLPVAGSFTQLLVAAAPAVEALAGAIDSIPTPLITLIGLMVTFRKIGGSDLFTNLRTGFADLADPTKGPGGFGASLKKSVGDMIAANAASVGLSLGLAAIGLAFTEEAEKAAEFDRAVSQIVSGLKEGESNTEAFTNVFERLVDEGGTGANVLAQLGISAEEFSVLVSKGGDLTENFARSLGLTTDELGILAPLLEKFEAELQAAAKQEVQAIQATGDLTDQQIEAAKAAATHADATKGNGEQTTDYVAVLGTLKEAQTQAAEAIGVSVDETGKLVEATGPAAEAADRLALALGAVQQGGVATNAELGFLAIAAGNAKVAEEDLQNVADQLGVSLDDLKTFVGSVADAVNQFADSTLATLPSVGDIIGDLGDDFSPRALLDKLTQATEDIANFQANIEALAAFPRVQQIAATNGPAVAAALAQPVKDGNTQVIQDLEDQAGAFDLHYAGLDESLRNELGPQIAEATGLTGTLATEAFGETFHPQEDATIATHGTAIAIANAAPEAVAAAGQLGTDSVDGYFETVGRMPGVATEISDQSNAAISAKRLGATLAGAFLGTGATGGFKSGVAAMPAAAGAAADLAVGQITLRQAIARTAGKGVGAAIADGLSAGISAASEAVASAAASLVQAAIARARAEAKSKSPSLLFAELGEDLAAGVVVGLADGTAAVEAASASLINAAAATTAASVSDVSVQPFGAGSSTGGIVVNAVPGMVAIDLSGISDPAVARRVGDSAASGFVDGLLQRRVTALAKVS